MWTETKYFFGASLFSRLENSNTNYCLDSYNNWSRFNGTDMLFSQKMNASCLTIKDVCCHDIKISSVNENLTTPSNTSLYQSNARETLGEYQAIGMQNGRWVYQKKWEDRFLEYGNKYWLANTGVGKKSGHMHHDGGSICPESITGEWQISSQDEKGRWSWTTDVELKVSCLKKSQTETEKPPGDPALFTHSHLVHKIEGKILYDLIIEFSHEIIISFNSGLVRYQIVREQFRSLLWLLFLSSRLRTDVNDPRCSPRPLPRSQVSSGLGQRSSGEEADHGNFRTLELYAEKNTQKLFPGNIVVALLGM